MTDLFKVVVNVETGEETTEPLSPEEIAAIKAEELRLAALPTPEEIAAEAAKAEADKVAILAKLGITADELKIATS